MIGGFFMRTLMILIYCDSVFDQNKVEPDYALEQNAAQSIGFKTHLISFEELTSGNVKKALQLIPELKDEATALYRGWMLTIQAYTLLYEALQEKNIVLINDPKAYKHCHYFPSSYHKIEGYTPKSFWSEPNAPLDEKQILELAANFDTAPIIVKDFVKSEKHHWEEACYIPNASDRNAVLKVTKQFLELRGDSLNEGLVFRAFEELEHITDHHKSGMPLTKEFRVFFLNGAVLALFPYWDNVDYGDQLPELRPFIEIAQYIESQFFTMDIAQKTNGEWIIMELGDGQVAGLLDNANISDFYRQILPLLTD